MSTLSERKKNYKTKSEERIEKRKKDAEQHSVKMKIIPQIYSNSTKTTGPGAGVDKAAMEEMQIKIGELSKNVTEAKEKTELLINNVTKVEEKTEILTSNVAKVEEKTAILTNNVTKVEEKTEILTNNVTKVEEKTEILTNNVTKVEEKTEILTNNVTKVEEKTEFIITDHTKFKEEVEEELFKQDDRIEDLEATTSELNESQEAKDVTAICNSITYGTLLNSISYSLVTQFYENRPVVYEHEECIRMIKELSVGSSAQTTSELSSSNPQTVGEAETFTTSELLSNEQTIDKAEILPIPELKSIREINISANRALIKDTALILMLKTELVKMNEYNKVVKVKDPVKKKALVEKYGFILKNDIDDYEITSKEKGKDLREDEQGNFYLVCKNGTPSSGRFDGANRANFIDTIGTIIDVDQNGMIDGTDITIIAGCNSSTYTSIFG